MIDVRELDDLDKNFLDERVEKYRKKAIERQEKLVQARNQAREEAEQCKKRAEAIFPTMLANIEKRIENASKKKLRKINVSCGDWLEGTFLMCMLFQTLPLNGFLCTPYYNGRYIEIRW